MVYWSFFYYLHFHNYAFAKSMEKKMTDLNYHFQQSSIYCKIIILATCLLNELKENCKTVYHVNREITRKTM